MKNSYLRYGRRFPIPSSVQVIAELRAGYPPVPGATADQVLSRPAKDLTVTV
jgi:hypothetical protein